MRDLYECYNNFDKYEKITSKLISRSFVQVPRLTIFIPTYQRAKTLEMTVQSAINQSYKGEYEILIVNNDPNADLNEIKAMLSKWNSSRVAYYVNLENIGLCGNWNRGIELARSKYVSMIHDDDILSPYFVEKIIDEIDDENVGVIGVDYISFTSQNLPKFQVPLKRLSRRKIMRQSFFFGRYINIAGITVKRELALQIGGYSEEYYPNEDTVFIYQAVLRSKVININFPLAGYRQEVNLSLKPGVMEQIIYLTEQTRRCIAKHEFFAAAWMKFFDAEFLYQYVEGANQYWKMELDHNSLFKICGLNKEVNTIRLHIARIVELVEKMFGKVMEAK